MRKVLLVLLAWMVTATLSLAETRISFLTPTASDDLRDELRASSLILATGQDGNPQDLLAAAQADYGRLLGVLYSNAFYGGVNTVTFHSWNAAVTPARASKPTSTTP